MPTHHRALSALATTALLSSGLALGTAGSAAAAPAQPAPVSRPQTGDGILDPILDPILGGLSVVTQPLLSTLGGAPGVGQLLTATAPVWNILNSLVATDVEWLCDGVPIPGTQGQLTFVPTQAQAGCQVAAKFVGRVLGILPVEAVTASVLVPLGVAPQTPVATKPVAVAGTPKVGGPLTATAPAWDTDATDVATTYQWLRGGTAITGATAASYTPTAEDLGKAVTVRATGTRDGAPEPATSTSSAVTVLLGDAPTAAAPAVSGAPRPGSTLTVAAPAWSGTGPVVTTYQWLRDGQPITGATTASYAVTEADAGRTLAARATGTRAGHAPGTATSQAVTVGAAEPLTATVPPSITRPAGGVTVGRTLTATPGTWSAPVTAVAYTWRRDGSTIPGATGPTYVVRPADVGRALSVAVTARATGFAEGTSSSPTVTVARSSSTTVARLSRTEVRKGAKVTLRVAVRSAAGAPTGTVRVLDGTRVLTKVVVRGTRTVRLRGLAVGRHRIRVQYVGSTTTAPSTSKVVVLTVRKRA